LREGKRRWLGLSQLITSLYLESIIVKDLGNESNTLNKIIIECIIRKNDERIVWKGGREWGARGIFSSWTRL